MNLTLLRQPTVGNATIGRLSINEAFECYTLEDVVRPPGEKVYGQTAIPAGRYQVVITHSPRFGADMPLLVDVPGFAGVRIHIGNVAEDTEGCILVGQTAGVTMIYKSRWAYEVLFSKLREASNAGEEAWLTIQDHGASA